MIDFEAARFWIEILTVFSAALGAVIGVKIGLNGMRKDIKTTAEDTHELRTCMDAATIQRQDLDRRLSRVEGEMKQIGLTLARMETI